HTDFVTLTFTVGGTWLMNPRVSTELRFNWSRETGRSDDTLDNFGGATPPPESALFPSTAPGDDHQFSFITEDGTLAFSYGKNLHNDQNQINVIDTVSMNYGSHQLKLGVDYRRLAPVYSSAKYSLQE